MRRARPVGGGRPLDPVTRARMGARFGADLGDVRVHADADAATSAHALGAAAYTVGRDIFFAAGRYRPAARDGWRLLAHELTHVLQQRRAPAPDVRDAPEVGAPDGAHEREAERWATSAADERTEDELAEDELVEDERAVLVERDAAVVAAASRHRLQPAEHRCSMEGTCPDDPLADHQGSGETTCDPATGTMGSTVTEHCAGDCVAQHEAVHRADRAPCCSRFKLCLDSAGADAGRLAACTTAFQNWFPTLSNWTECNAYRREVACLNDAIPANCGPRGAASAECCRTLRQERNFARRQRRTHCAAARNSPCPFRADGSLPRP